MAFLTIFMCLYKPTSTNKPNADAKLKHKLLIHKYAMPMATPFALALSLTISLFTLKITSNAIAPSSTQQKHIVTRLIHRDSILSPYYNPKESISDRMGRMVESSIQRITYLHSMIKHSSADYSQLNLHPVTSEPLLFVNFSIGHPPIPQLAIMDTGSSLLWVQCVPCKQCSHHIGPIFDPFNSASYSSLSCKNIICNYVPDGDCNKLNQCIYTQHYVKGISSFGVIATEQLIFENSYRGMNVVNGLLFGCSHENGHYKDMRFSGIFGLGSELMSPITQMGSKFSYCLGSLVDPHYSYSHLVLGDATKFEGDSTPLEIEEGHYKVTLEGISVGEKMLLINPNTYTRKRRGVIIDTGTAVTWLAKNEYRALEREIRDLLDGCFTSFAKDKFLCYKGTLSNDLIGFPVVTFHFSGGADLVLDAGSMFYQATPGIFCMAVRETSVFGDNFGDFSVIGLMAQQYYNIAYDLTRGKLFIQRIDCELLE